ncbi:MAG: ATP-binding protein [Candidatus Aminicenantes bacterium]|nr:ATP-binding protein [Candidatus Aminicenantes bacterium]
MNPFKYGRVVFDEDFCPRPGLEKHLRSYISSGQNVLLEGERRTGKTSLIYRTVRGLPKLRLLYVDILEIKTVSDLCRRIVNAVVSMEQKSGMVERVFKSLVHLKPTMTLDPLTGVPALSLDASIKLKPGYIEGLMDLIEEENKRKNLIVVFDEFQDILNLKEAAEALAVLRSKVQFHAAIPYIFSGSVRNQMDEIFNHPESAFFKSAVTLNVGELERDIFGNFLRGKFSKGKRTLSQSLLDKVFDIARDIPGDVQQLCGAAWDATSPGDHIDEKTLPAALELIYSRELKGYEASLNRLTGQQFRCIVGLSRIGGRSPMSSEFTKATGISQPASVKKALTRLIKLRIIYRYKREYKFINPFFRSWLIYKNY